MRPLEDKSNINIKAAKLLFEKEFYSSVCHSAYYAYFQLAKQKLADLGMSIKEQNRQSYELSMGSHVLINNMIKGKLECQVNKRTAREFYVSCKQLKSFRQRADYKEDMICKTDAKRSIDLSEKIRQEITNLRKEEK